MLAAVLTAPNQLQLQEIPSPSAGPGEVLVKIGANTICGTDIRIVQGEKTSGVELPVILGHESAGHVAEVGPGVSGYEVGTPVAMAPVVPCRRCWQCRHDLENLCGNTRILGYAVDGGMAEYMLVPAEAIAAGCLFVANQELPSEQLALAEPLSCVVNGQRWSRVEVDDLVLVMGAGPIGLFHLQLALLAGARAVIVSDPSAARRSQAERLGATVTADPTGQSLEVMVEDLSRGVGVDVSVICVGAPKLVNQAVQLSRSGGRINVFAGLKGEGWAQIEANLVHYKQVLLTGSANSRRADYETALRLIESGRIDTASMVTHRFPLSAVAEAMDAVRTGVAIKVAVLP